MELYLSNVDYSNRETLVTRPDGHLGSWNKCWDNTNGLYKVSGINVVGIVRDENDNVDFSVMTTMLQNINAYGTVTIEYGEWSNNAFVPSVTRTYSYAAKETKVLREENSYNAIRITENVSETNGYFQFIIGDIVQIPADKVVSVNVAEEKDYLGVTMPTSVCDVILKNDSGIAFGDNQQISLYHGVTMMNQTVPINAYFFEKKEIVDNEKTKYHFVDYFGLLDKLGTVNQSANAVSIDHNCNIESIDLSQISKITASSITNVGWVDELTGRKHYFGDMSIREMLCSTFLAANKYYQLFNTLSYYPSLYFSDIKQDIRYVSVSSGGYIEWDRLSTYIGGSFTLKPHVYKVVLKTRTLVASLVPTDYVDTNGNYYYLKDEVHSYDDGTKNGTTKTITLPINMSGFTSSQIQALLQQIYTTLNKKTYRVKLCENAGFYGIVNGAAFVPADSRKTYKIYTTKDGSHYIIGRIAKSHYTFSGNKQYGEVEILVDTEV